MKEFHLKNHSYANKKTIVYALLITYIVLYAFFLTCFTSNFDAEEEDASSGAYFPEFTESEQNDYDWRWTWVCINKTCSRQRYTSGKQISLQKCNMLCFQPQLWPMPRKVLQHTKKYVSFTTQQLHFQSKVKQPARGMLKKAYGNFVTNIAHLIRVPVKAIRDMKKIFINIIISDHMITTLKLDTREGYTLTITNIGINIIVRITADNYFGARHALETLSQLIWFDNVGRTLNLVSEIDIEDKPSFPYRGLMVDTARNYFPVQLLLKVIDGMAANKLNIFHWHLTDSQSFPFLSSSYPDLAKYGSYEPAKVYNISDIKSIITYAKLRGVRVILEVDAPSHVLSGWKEINSSTPLILPDEANLNGQLNPNNLEALNILKGIYGDILQLTDDELFHIGGDEINFDMWTNDMNVDKRAALNSWAFYMHKIISTLTDANGNKVVKRVILWSSLLTNSQQIRRFLNPNITTIIQYWFGYINMFLVEELNLKLIFSYVNPWYLDCGFGAWREKKEPNCNPYRTWQDVYKAKPWRSLKRIEVVLGGEVCMWTEQVGEDSLETRLWPRSAAFGERAWSNPGTRNNVISSHTYTRLDTQRERMSRRNIKSEVLWPRYCTLNPGKC